jgi:hypothetical protein
VYTKNFCVRFGHVKTFIGKNRVPAFCFDSIPFFPDKQFFIVISKIMPMPVIFAFLYIFWTKLKNIESCKEIKKIAKKSGFIKNNKWRVFRSTLKHCLSMVWRGSCSTNYNHNVLRKLLVAPCRNTSSNDECQYDPAEESVGIYINYIIEADLDLVNDWENTHDLLGVNRKMSTLWNVDFSQKVYKIGV